LSCTYIKHSGLKAQPTSDDVILLRTVLHL